MGLQVSDKNTKEASRHLNSIAEKSLQEIIGQVEDDTCKQQLVVGRMRGGSGF